MSAFTQFKTNSSVETDGVWHDYGDFKVRIARAGGSNKKFARLLEAKTKPYQRAMRTDTMDNDIAARLMREVYAEVVVTGWQTKDKDGAWKDEVEVDAGMFEPTSPASVLKALAALPDLFADIQEQAQKMALFRDEVRDTNAGN